MNPEVNKKLCLMTKDDSKKLYACTIRTISRYRFLSGNTDQLPKGNTAEDIIQTVIKKAISRERKWDPQRGELLPWLCEQVRSEVDKLFKSAANKHEMRFPNTTPTQSDLSERDDAPTTDMPDKSSLDPVDALLKKEEDANASKVVAKLFNATKDDSDLEAMLIAMMGDCPPKPRFLAEYLGVPIEEIRNRYKRLRRLAMPFKEEV